MEVSPQDKFGPLMPWRRQGPPDAGVPLAGSGEGRHRQVFLAAEEETLDPVEIPGHLETVPAAAPDDEPRGPCVVTVCDGLDLFPTDEAPAAPTRMTDQPGLSDDHRVAKHPPGQIGRAS